MSGNDGKATEAIRLTVPFHDCDMLGVVWHGRYMKYFEQARCAVFAKYAIDVPDIRELGYRMFITEASCRYTYPLTYGDDFTVQATITSAAPHIRVAYRVKNETQKRSAARGLTVLATTDSEGKLLTSTPATILQRLPKALGAVSMLLCAFFLLCLTSTTAAAKPPSKSLDTTSVKSLLADFARIQGLEAAFVEKKHLALLVKPLVSHGTLYFRAPGYLRRVTTKPRQSVVLVTPQAAQILSNGKVKSIDLTERKDVRALVQSLTWILSGNHNKLANDYNMELSRPADGKKIWQLRLVPKRAPLTKLIRTMTISGDGHTVQSVEVVEVNGDRSVTEIITANPNRVFSKQEKSKLFSPLDEPRT